MSKPTIQVWETQSLGLIILCPTGVLISNQTGGYACLHPEVEGIYVPLLNDAHELEAFFTGPKWQGHCYDGIDEETADFIDAFLMRPTGGELAFIRVNRDRLKDSHEAWVYVDVTEPPATQGINLFTGFGIATGILTWPNSD